MKNMRFNLLAFSFYISIIAFGQTTRHISVDVTKVKGTFSTMFKECVGAGRANEGLRADWQQQLAQLKKDCGFKFIRFHGLLTDDMAVYYEDRNGKPHLNFQYIDPLFDYILSIGMKPFVELGFMPNALASGPQTIFWWKGNVTPPRNYEKWHWLVQNLVQHFTERYGTEEVKSWYFECWNEPNLNPGFFTGTQADYFKLYQYTASAVKAVNPAYKVGGPATAGAAWVPETIAFCANNKVPIDFISTHSYGVRQGFLDEYGTTGTVLDSNRNAVSVDVLRSRSQIAQSALPALELHYTEWSSSYTPSDPIHDSYHEAAYILDKLKQVGTAANSMSYWVFTDIFEESAPRLTPFHGGFGLMNMQGIKKPAYFAYSFLNKMGETELVNNDSESWACKNAKGDVQLLLWDYTYTLPQDSTNNQAYYVKKLPAHLKGNVTLNLSGLAPGNYQMQVTKVGYKANDAHTAYIEMNRPEQLTKAQVEALHKASTGKPIVSKSITVGSKGKFGYNLSLHENDVYLVQLFRK